MRAFPSLRRSFVLRIYSRHISYTSVLRAWGERNLSEHKTASIGYYLFWYGAFGIASSALNMIASLLLCELGAG